MKAYLFLADGFEEVEALTTADILIRAGVDVQLVKIPTSNEVCKAVRGSHNIKIKPVTVLFCPEVCPVQRTLDQVPMLSNSSTHTIIQVRL